jgi:hypothetical protein
MAGEKSIEDQVDETQRHSHDHVQRWTAITAGHELRPTSGTPQAMTTTADLAVDLGFDEGDVDVMLELLDERGAQLPDQLAASIRHPARPTRRTHCAGGALLTGLRLATTACVRARRAGPDRA